MIKNIFLSIWISFLNRALKFGNCVLKSGNGVLRISKKLSTSAWLFLAVTFGVASALSFISLKSVRSTEICLKEQSEEQLKQPVSGDKNAMKEPIVEYYAVLSPPEAYAHVPSVKEIKSAVMTETVTKTIVIRQKTQSEATLPVSVDAQQKSVAVVQTDFEERTKIAQEDVKYCDSSNASIYMAFTSSQGGQNPKSSGNDKIVPMKDEEMKNLIALVGNKSDGQILGIIVSTDFKPVYGNKFDGQILGNSASTEDKPAYGWQAAESDLTQYMYNPETLINLSACDSGVIRPNQAISDAQSGNSADIMTFNVFDGKENPSKIEASVKAEKDINAVKPNQKIYRKRRVVKTYTVKKRQNKSSTGEISAISDKVSPIFAEKVSDEKTEINADLKKQSYFESQFVGRIAKNNMSALTSGNIFLHQSDAALNSFKLGEVHQSVIVIQPQTLNDTNKYLVIQKTYENLVSDNVYIVPINKFYGVVKNVSSITDKDGSGDKPYKTDWRLLLLFVGTTVTVISMIATIIFGTITAIISVTTLILALISNRRATFESELKFLEYQLKQAEDERDRLEHSLRMNLLQLQTLKLKEEFAKNPA